MIIIPGIHQLRIPIPDNPLEYLNSYLLEGIDGWLMIDTGWYTPDAFNAMETELKNLGLTLQDIAIMVVTHVHPDHFGLAGKIKQVSPRTELLTHRWESDLIESRYIKFYELQDKMAPLLKKHGVPAHLLQILQTASMPTLEFVTFTLPDRALYGGEIVSTGIFDLEIIWTPGHSPGHICLYEPQNRLLFAGDHLLPTITPNISYHVQSGDNPLGDYINSLQKIRKLPVDKVLPAHEYIFTNMPGRIDEIMLHHEQRKAEILQLIIKRPLTAYEISSRIKWNVPGTWENFAPPIKRSAVTETISHLECMRWEGTVNRILKDQLVLYQAM